MDRKQVKITGFLRLVGFLVGLGCLYAQPPGPPTGPPPAARAGAPVDLTGTWVALVTEDWRYRMAMPPKGDYIGVPLNPEGRKMADAWDPAKDEAAGEQCRAYGAAGILRVPGRLRISWQGDETLLVETDAGTQKRTLVFKGAATGAGTWQGSSTATWDRPGSPFGFQLGLGITGGVTGGSLKTVTTQMKPGYLRKNGVPYSAGAVLTEYWDRFDVPGGDALLVVSSELVDPTYLGQPFWTSAHFKRMASGAGWSPSGCSAR